MHSALLAPLAILGLHLALLTNVHAAQRPGTGSGSQRVEDGATLEVSPKESIVFDMKGLKRLSITDPTIADVVVIAPGEFRLDGIGPGRTTLYVWDGTTRRRCDVVVAPRAPQPSSREVHLSSQEGDVKVVVPVGRVGWLAGDLQLSFRLPNAKALTVVTIPKENVTGFYNAREKLLIHYATLVDPSEAILDVDYDYATKTGKISLQLTPAAVSGVPTLAPHAGKVSVMARPLSPHVYK